MWEMLREGLSWILLIGGSFFIFVGAVGLLRFPDFYSRIHGAGVTDTLGVELILFGLMLQSDDWLLIVKLSFFVMFLFFSSPVATHAVAHSAFIAGLKPKTGRMRLTGEPVEPPSKGV